MKKVSLVIALILFITGCSSTTYTKRSSTESDSARLETTTSRTHFNGKTITAVVLDVQQIDPKTGENLPESWKRTAHMLESDSLMDRLIIAVMAGTGAAAIQGTFFRAAMHAKSCRGGANCGTVFNPLLQAFSGSNSVSETDVGVGIDTSSAAMAH